MGLDCEDQKPPDKAAQCLSELRDWHDLAIKNCNRAFRICRGQPPDPTDLPQRFTQPQKDFFSASGQGLATVGVGTMAAGIGVFTVAAVSPEPKPVAQGMGIAMTGIGIALIIGAASTIAKIRDPVDKNFKKKALPRPPKPPVIMPVPGLNQEVADAVNAVLENQAKAVGIDRALMTSINRAQGAVLAKEPDFEKMQMTNAREYAGQVSQLIGQSASLRSTATNKLRSSGIMLAATDDQAREMRSMIIENGIPEQIHNIIQAYGSNPQERDDIEGTFIMSIVDINALKAPFPDSMTPAGLSSAEQSIASALKEFSTSAS